MSKKHSYISALNVLSAFAVVVLHANGYFWKFQNSPAWICSNILESVFYFAVPVFFMLTGCTLLDYPEEYDTKTYFRKRLQKTLLPFLFWSLAGGLLTALRSDNGFPVEMFTFEGIWNGILHAEYMPVYWFFLPLFGIYALIPLLAHIEAGKKLKYIGIMAAITFAGNIAFPFLFQVLNSLLRTQLVWPFSLPVGEYLFFVLAGYVLHHWDMKPKFRCILYVLALGGLITQLAGTHILSMRDGVVNGFFKGYTNLPCVLQALGVFVLVKYGFERFSFAKLQNLIEKIHPYTFALYLLHTLAQVPCAAVAARLQISAGTVPYTLFLTATILPSCIAVTFLLRKIPGVRHLLP